MRLDVLFFLGVIVALMGVFWVLSRRWERPHLRYMPVFSKLRGAVELAVEDGSRIHVSIGRSDITSPHSGVALVGLSMLRQIAVVASDSDSPPVATTGNGMMALLAQDTMRGAYKSIGLENSYSNSSVRVVGITPYSFGAGMISVILDEDVSSNILAGSFRDEIGLATTARSKREQFMLAGTDTLAGQAVIYATASQPLIGEEVFAGNAYLSDKPIEVASLYTQDVLRWVVIVLVVLSAIGGLFGAGGTP